MNSNAQTRKFIPYAVLFLVFGIGLWITRANITKVSPTETENGSEPTPSPIVESAPTDFSETGTFTFSTSPEDPAAPTLVYKETQAKKLVFDELSFCATANGSTPCMAMSVTLDKPFGGKQVSIEGNLQGESEVLVRKLQLIEGREFAFLTTSGNIFISWPQAQEYIKNCQVDMAMQAHSLNVDLTLKDGKRVRTVEPMIDDVFKVVNGATEKCGNIGIATE